jgi:TRAP-type C4-dicarboxylate transport system permease small subunit
MRIPMYIPYIAMPVGLSLSIVHFIHNIVKLFTVPDQAEQSIYSSEHIENGSIGGGEEK